MSFHAFIRVLTRALRGLHGLPSQARSGLAAARLRAKRHRLRPGPARRLAAAVTAAALGLLWPVAVSATQAFELTIVVTGARSAQGQVSAALYDSEQGWLETMVRGERVAAGDRCVLVFRGLPAGTYAVAAFHDENGNGKLDRNLLGMPIEPFGFSRDAAANFGPPKFADAVLTLDAHRTLAIKLQ
jgi:uncharacterized protein (DUF2141 family)